MQFQTIILTALVAATPALAFTNGSLVPPYICNPTPDGLPKSFGQLLLFTREQTPKVAFSPNAKQNVQAPALAKQGNLQIGNSAYILASFHDSPNNITSINQGIVVKTANGGPLVAGTANKLVLSSGSANVALKGALLYAQDASGARQGSFTDNGNTNIFVPFPGCGKNPQGQINGMIQQTGISATGTYSNLVYNAPACVTSKSLTIAGLSVTGKGFGTWKYNFAVTGSTCSTTTGTTGTTGTTNGTSTQGQGQAAQAAQGSQGSQAAQGSSAPQKAAKKKASTKPSAKPCH